jgi:hypothetical protein
MQQEGLVIEPVTGISSSLWLAVALNDNSNIN